MNQILVFKSSTENSTEKKLVFGISVGIIPKPRPKISKIDL